MKKLISLLLTLTMIAALAACGDKAQPETTAVTETAAPAETTEAAISGMANPMAEVGDTEEFQKELGIYIDANLLYSDAKMYIIGGTVAECQFQFEDSNGKTVECTLRATKDEEAAQNLPGIYEELADEEAEAVTTASGDIVIARQKNQAGDIDVYTWEIDDTCYSLVLQGQPGEPELSEVKESVLNAIGVEPLAEAEAVTDALPEYELTEGDTLLTVHFESNPTTGYQWSYKIWDEGSLEAVSEVYEQTPGTEGMAGAGGIWTASFRTVKNHPNYETNKTNYIEFTYSRQWEDGSMPSRVVDVLIHGATMEVIGYHTPDFNQAIAPNGTYDVTLAFTDMIEKDALNHYALIGIPVKIIFPDEKVQSLKIGDSFNMAEYGGDDYIVTVQELTKTSDTRIVISDFESLEYDKDLNGWFVVGPNDDVFTYNSATYKVYFTNETKINDQMEEVMKTGNSGTIYDKMRSYRWVNATVTVKDGWVSEITIHYHP